MTKKLVWVANDTKKPRTTESYVWRMQFIEGEPKPLTNKDSVESLKAMGMIGLYKEVKE